MAVSGNYLSLLCLCANMFYSFACLGFSQGAGNIPDFMVEEMENLRILWLFYKICTRVSYNM